MNDVPTAAATAQAAAPTAATSKRRRGLMALGGVAILGGVVYGSYWFLSARHYQSTDDAYVDGDLVQIPREGPGPVIPPSADDPQGGRRDKTFLKLDPADARVALGNADARLAGAVRE